jgi:hypothetical protein
VTLKTGKSKEEYLKMVLKVQEMQTMANMMHDDGEFQRQFEYLNTALINLRLDAYMKMKQCSHATLTNPE